MSARFILAWFILPAMFGQSPPAFEVASVKPADPNGRIIDVRIEPGGRLTLQNMTLLRMVQLAYSHKWYWISGGPSWIDTARFDIAAKAQGNPQEDEVLKMLQTLLEDRFKLKLHKETKEGSVYNLVAGKGGAKINPAKDKNADSFVGGRFNATAHILIGQNATMEQLALRFEDELRRPVFDRTGLAGNFDFKLEYTADDSKPENGPSLVTAVQEQLGLKLESAKGPLETLVVDRAEKPTGNE